MTAAAANKRRKRHPLGFFDPCQCSSRMAGAECQRKRGESAPRRECRPRKAGTPGGEFRARWQPVQVQMRGAHRKTPSPLWMTRRERPCGRSAEEGRGYSGLRSCAETEQPWLWRPVRTKARVNGHRHGISLMSLSILGACYRCLPTLHSPSSTRIPSSSGMGCWRTAQSHPAGARRTGITRDIPNMERPGTACLRHIRSPMIRAVGARAGIAPVQLNGNQEGPIPRNLPSPELPPQRSADEAQCASLVCKVHWSFRSGKDLTGASASPDTGQQGVVPSGAAIAERPAGKRAVPRLPRVIMSSLLRPVHGPRSTALPCGVPCAVLPC